jgi:hypothetical protein
MNSNICGNRPPLDESRLVDVSQYEISSRESAHPPLSQETISMTDDGTDQFPRHSWRQELGRHLEQEQHFRLKLLSLLPHLQ